jgi:glutamine cyclotransferase
VFYEGTGQVGQSSIRRVEVETGKILQQRDVPAPHFGEGIAVWKDHLFQITWLTHVAFVYDRQTFQSKKQLSYPGEGWGLTHDGTDLIMSDGTSELRVLDAVTFVEKRRIGVTAAGVPLRELNGIEFVKGDIFANICPTDYIARIAADTGKVSAFIDLRGLLPSRDERAPTSSTASPTTRRAIGCSSQASGGPKVFEIKLVRKDR